MTSHALGTTVDRPWVDFRVQQFAAGTSSDSVTNARRALADYAQKPVFAFETSWEGTPGKLTADQVRTGAWGSLMGGAFYLYAECFEPTLTWGDGDAFPFVEIMNDFLYDGPYWKLSPNAGLVNSGSLCLADPGQRYVIYRQTGGTMTIDLSGVSGVFHAEWLNPRTGAKTPAEKVEGGAKRSFIFSGWQRLGAALDSQGQLTSASWQRSGKMKRILMSSVLALALFGPHAVRGAPVLDDPLQGSTTGTRSGGKFVAGGWQVTGKDDTIYWHLPTIAQGAAEFDVCGLGPKEGRAGMEDKSELFHMYDHTVGDADDNYLGGYRDNPFKHFIRKIGALDAAKADAMEIVWQIQPHYEEPDTARLPWARGGDVSLPRGVGAGRRRAISVLKLYRNGTLLLTTSVPGPWQPAGLSVRIGASPRRDPTAGAPIGAVFSNVKVWNLAKSAGRVRLRDHSLCDDDGPLLGLGVSYFQALRHAKYDRQRLNDNLALLAAKGFNYVRILSMVSWDGLEIAPVTFTNRTGRVVEAWPDYWQQFRDLLDSGRPARTAGRSDHLRRCPIRDAHPSGPAGASGRRPGEHRRARARDPAPGSGQRGLAERLSRPARRRRAAQLRSTSGRPHGRAGGHHVE